MRRTLRLAVLLAAACSDPTEDPDLHREVPCSAEWEPLFPEPLAACDLPCATPENYVESPGNSPWVCNTDRGRLCSMATVFEHGEVRGCCNIVGYGTSGNELHVVEFAVCVRDCTGDDCF